MPDQVGIGLIGDLRIWATDGQTANPASSDLTCRRLRRNWLTWSASANY